MNALSEIAAATPRQRTDAALKLAILAVGGQGGGVLTNWIIALAEREGWRAQATSVAGVAQRTGATIYYVEMAPDVGRDPIFALSPAPNDVDVLVAAEMMEAGRAIMRGFCAPGRTTLIASTHRQLAVGEKIRPADGRADAATVRAAAEMAAARLVSFDMEAIAEAHGAVISASLFGAICGAGVLPFPRETFEATIRESGRGVDASLAAFGAAADRAEAGDVALPETVAAPAPAPVEPRGPERLLAEWRRLSDRAAALPEPARGVATAGLRKVVDFQDLRYGAEYLDGLERAAHAERDACGETGPFTAAAAKHLANAMAYDDIPRVADLKARAARLDRIRREMGAGEVMTLTEYMHPRGEEFVSVLPAPLGRFCEARPGLMRWIDRRINKGRRLRTDTVFGFGLLWLVAGTRRFRRIMRRHQVETEHRTAWFETALRRLSSDPGLAVETLNARRLIKGYSDTHARGLSKFDRVMAGLAELEGAPGAAETARALIVAALEDPKGEALDRALAELRSTGLPRAA